MICLFVQDVCVRMHTFHTTWSLCSFLVFMLLKTQTTVMFLVVLSVDSILTSQKITCIYSAWTMQCQRPWSPCWYPAVCLTVEPLWDKLRAGTQACSTYRIYPIQERAKRPLSTINNRAAGFVTCLWENERACDEVRERGWPSYSS